MNLNLKEDLLLVRDVSGRTAGHLAAEMGNAGTLKEIFDWAKEEKLDFEVDLLLAKDWNRQTPLELLKDCCFISEDTKAQALQQWNCYLHDA
jgi:ankyrin repeat protein